MSRDVRARKLDRDWLIHFRADAPANAGFRVGDTAFSWAMDFGEGKELKRASDAELAAARRFVDAGVLISDTYLLDGEAKRVGSETVLEMREAITTDHMGVLELEAVILYLLARECRVPGQFVELGSMFGGSTAAIGLGCRARSDQRRVIAVDDHRWHRHVPRADKSAVEQYPNTLGIFQANVERAGLAQVVELIIGDTSAAAARVTDGAALLFVDADHSLSGIKRDLGAWMPKVVDQGIAAFHDYANDMWPDVRQAVDALAGQWRAFSVLQTLAVAKT